MSPQWFYYAALVLLALLKDATAHPSGGAEPLVTTPRTPVSKEALAAACPHTIRRLATDQEVTGTWYALETIHTKVVNVSQPFNKKLEACGKFNVTIAGDNLSIDVKFFHGGVLNISQDFTFSRVADEMWKEQSVDELTIFGVSTDSTLVAMCQIIKGDIKNLRSALLGRSPEISEQQRQSTHGTSAAASDINFYDPQHCVAPPSNKLND